MQLTKEQDDSIRCQQ